MSPNDDMPQGAPPAPGRRVTAPKAWVWVGVLVLFLLHQDVWLWSNADLWLGPLPAGLAYHAGYSVVVALFWLAVVRFAWPFTPEAPDGGEPS